MAIRCLAALFLGNGGRKVDHVVAQVDAFVPYNEHAVPCTDQLADFILAFGARRTVPEVALGHGSNIGGRER